MTKFGHVKWTSFLVALILAFGCLGVPSFAASKKSDSSKKTEQTEDGKNKSKKSDSKKKSTKKKKDAQKDSSRADSKKSDTKKKDKKSSKKSKKKKVKIDTRDPKAYTKMLLYEKEGVEVEVVDLNQKFHPPKEAIQTVEVEDIPDSLQVVEIEDEGTEFFDFSTMLIPVTHEARLGSPYGVRDHRLHRGVDVQVIKDEPMVAAYPGRVIMSKYNKGGYGHYVLLEHDNGLQTLYGHLSKRTVKVGDYVYPGDIVGLAGNTGRSSGAHLHFEIRLGEINIDPATVINFPKWELQDGVEHMSKKKIRNAHYKMQQKLKKENFYEVKAGDTLQDVALWFNISVDAVIRINNLKKDQPIRVGQVLKGCK